MTDNTSFGVTFGRRNSDAKPRSDRVLSDSTRVALHKADPSATLTPRTAIGGSAAELEDFQQRSATWAASSLVALGQKRALAHALDGLFGGGATCNRGLENLAHFQKEARELAWRKIIDPFGRIDTRLKQDLVRVTVPDTSNDFLIHQHRFHVTLEATHRGPERIEIESSVERVRPQLFIGDKINSVVGQANASPNHSLVGVSEAAIVGEMETHPGEGRFFIALLDELERACYAEIQGQPAASIDIRHQILTMAAGGNELGALKAVGESLGGEFAKNAHIAHGDPTDRLAQTMFHEHPLKAFDIW